MSHRVVSGVSGSNQRITCMCCISDSHFNPTACFDPAACAQSQATAHLRGSSAHQATRVATSPETLPAAANAKPEDKHAKSRRVCYQKITEKEFGRADGSRRGALQRCALPAIGVEAKFPGFRWRELSPERFVETAQAPSVDGRRATRVSSDLHCTRLVRSVQLVHARKMTRSLNHSGEFVHPIGQQITLEGSMQGCAVAALESAPENAKRIADRGGEINRC